MSAGNDDSERTVTGPVARDGAPSEFAQSSSMSVHTLPEGTRIRDYKIVEPFWLRLVGVGHVVLVSSDRSTPQATLRAVPQVARLKDEIRTHTERQRQRRGVRDLDVDPHTPPPKA